jgi:hypothetical protein
MRRQGPLAAIVGLVGVVVLAGCIATIAVRADDSGSSSTSTGASGRASSSSPTDVSVAYYGYLRQQNASAAFSLLCPAQQEQGEGMFAQTLGLDGASGTGITLFTVDGNATIGTHDASVPATVGLQNGQTLSFTVLLTRGTDGWQVCSSDLGGVLPAPGASSAPSSAV